jgi:hypothetical protein
VTPIFSWEYVKTMPKERLNRYRYVWGHRVHDFDTLVDHECSRITMIRDPEVLYISNYLWFTDQENYSLYIPDRTTAMKRLADNAEMSRFRNGIATRTTSYFGDVCRS